MEQMLTKIIAVQNAWHADSVYARPVHLRLQQQLRRTRLKCDLDLQDDDADEAGVVGEGMSGLLRRKVNAPGADMEGPVPI